MCCRLERAPGRGTFVEGAIVGRLQSSKPRRPPVTPWRDGRSAYAMFVAAAKPSRLVFRWAGQACRARVGARRAGERRVRRPRNGDRRPTRGRSLRRVALRAAVQRRRYDHRIYRLAGRSDDFGPCRRSRLLRSSAGCTRVVLGPRRRDGKDNMERVRLSSRSRAAESAFSTHYGNRARWRAHGLDRRSAQ